MKKPNGQYYLPPSLDAVLDFTRKLPIKKISGIGNVRCFIADWSFMIIVRSLSGS